ncbi:MAG TPA: transglycosylase SLT domain-containing protein [Candidatus Aenigmarchaeota archaeon]|nr:transglycosylase SLT domain-containing protein [Candidatus Aenigmarchaeota archaeon]
MNKKLIITILVLSTLLLSAQAAHAEGFLDIFTLFTNFFGSQEPAVSMNGNEVQANGPCSQQCGQDCSLEKCVNQDGCIWNKGNCDNICTPGEMRELIIIKKYEGCSNAANCNDVYLCENGVTGNPISAAFSTVSKSATYSNPDIIYSDIPIVVDDSNYVPVDSGPSVNPDYVTSGGAVSCSNLPASFVAGYNQYSAVIRSAADNYLRNSGIDNPEALIAGIISIESAWNPRAVSPCSSAGIAQFIGSTARTYDLYVPPTPGGYEWAWCPDAQTTICKAISRTTGNLVKTKVASCNSCTPNNCKYDQDERFNPEKSIDALANHVKDLMNRCENLDGAIKAYNSGNCASEANTGYFSTVKNYYLKWRNCLSGSTNTQTSSDIQYIEQVCTSPEGLAGTCQYATASGCTFYDRLCPGSSNIKCCVPDSTFTEQSCTAYGAIGTCLPVDTPGYTFPYSGFCPGPANIKCGFPATSTGYVTAKPIPITGMDTSDISAPDLPQPDLTSLDASLAQQSSVLQEGQYTISEKINIQNNDEDFIYTDDQGTILNPQCNIDPINTGIRDYWIGLQTSSDVCIGMHSVAPPEHDCGNAVKSEEIRNIFENIQSGTIVTVKDPYQTEGNAVADNQYMGDESNPTIIIESSQMAESTQTAEGISVTGLATGIQNRKTAKSQACRSICSGTLSQWGYNLLGLGDCATKCAQKGCYWENGACTATPTICRISERRSTTFDQGTISSRLEAVKKGYKGFVLNDPLCLGVNCAKYVTRVHEYIFGIGKHFITGVGGDAWNMPSNIKNHGGSVRWFDWRNNEIFNNYDSMLPGDVIGFYYSESNYHSDKILGIQSGNTPEIDFTHVALYLGKIGNNHIITHLYHAPKSQPVRTESIESFLQKYGNLFKIRAVMRPSQERLYRTFDKNDVTEYNTARIEAGDSMSSIVGISLKKEEYMWVTANINSMVENVNIAKYTGNTIKVPQNLPEYFHDYDVYYPTSPTELAAQLGETIKINQPSLSNTDE